MKNCEMKLEGDILTITVDISKEFDKSSTGKSIIISTDRRKISVNQYRPQPSN